jgi:flagellar protein FlaF
MFIAFGSFYTATANSVERVQTAQDERGDRALEAQNTAIEITNASWDASASTLSVNVSNNGSSELEISEVDLLANNTYQSGYDTAVGGETGTDLLLPGETLEITVTALAEDPGRVKVVTGPGVEATTTTEVI